MSILNMKSVQRVRYQFSSKSVQKSVTGKCIRADRIMKTGVENSFYFKRKEIANRKQDSIISMNFVCISVVLSSWFTVFML